MTPREQVLSQLTANPEQSRAVVADDTKNGGYAAALAVRTPLGIVSAVFEWDDKSKIAITSVPLMIYGVMDALEEGSDPAAAAKRMIALEGAARVSVVEDVMMKPRQRNKAAY